MPILGRDHHNTQLVTTGKRTTFGQVTAAPPRPVTLSPAQRAIASGDGRRVGGGEGGWLPKGGAGLVDYGERLIEVGRPANPSETELCSIRNGEVADD